MAPYYVVPVAEKAEENLNASVGGKVTIPQYHRVLHNYLTKQSCCKYDHKEEALVEWAWLHMNWSNLRENVGALVFGVL